MKSFTQRRSGSAKGAEHEKENDLFLSASAAEALRQLRKESYVRAIDDEFALGSQLSARDEKAVRKTVSGLLKILHPHGEWTRAELREYLEFALEGRRRVKEQLKKLAAHDYAKTFFSYLERDSGHEYWVGLPEQPDDMAPAVADLEDDGRDSFPEAVAQTLTQVIEGGEGRHVEYKQTGRYNGRSKQRDPVLEHTLVRTVTAFLNAGGGILLIGVSDAGQVTGIEPDLKTLGAKQSLDGYTLWLNNLLNERLGPVAVSRVTITFESTADGTVCRVDVSASVQPVYAKNLKGDKEFHVRQNAATRTLDVADTVQYIHSHWR